MKSAASQVLKPIILVAALAATLPAFAQLVVQGDVVLEDGSPPPKPVAIERICSGSKQPEGVTDRKGHFRFELGRLSSTTVDASLADPGGTVLTNPGTGPLSVTEKSGGAAGAARIAREAMAAEAQSCQLRAVLAGFHPALIDMSGISPGVGDVGTIILRRIVTPQDKLARGAAEERSKAAKAPGATKELSETDKTLAKARQALRENRLPDAERELEHLVEIEPNHADAWYELGRLYEQESRRADASRSYARAIAADPTLAGPYVTLAGLQAQDQQWKDLVDTTEKLIRINPADFPAAYLYKAVGYYNLGDLDEAGKAARDGLQMDPTHRAPRLHHMLGTILADDRNFSAAAEQMKLYLQYAPAARDRDEAQKLADEWEKLAGAPPAGKKPQ